MGRETVRDATAAQDVPHRQIRAGYDEESITVYQAFGPQIAVPAVRHGRFTGAFKRERMTWIKPSFRWMMYRCGWAAKPGQEHVLAVRISRPGFAWALGHSAFAHFDRDLHADRQAWRETLSAPVRIQWDPERDLRLRPLAHRSIQIGLGEEAVRRYCENWILEIRDVTELAREVRRALLAEGEEAAAALLPPERPYPVPESVAARIGCSGTEAAHRPGAVGRALDVVHDPAVHHVFERLDQA